MNVTECANISKHAAEGSQSYDEFYILYPHRFKFRKFAFYHNLRGFDQFCEQQ